MIDFNRACALCGRVFDTMEGQAVEDPSEYGDGIYDLCHPSDSKNADGPTCYERWQQGERPGDGAKNEYELVMPFVVCESTGGPFADAAFVAGWTCGAIDKTLHNAHGTHATFSWWVDPKLIPQIDLIAMQHQFRISATEPWDEHPDEVVALTITNEPAKEGE